MTDTILPHELPQALERAPQAKVLSLDCFDTLLWRDTHKPSGVFGDLAAISPGQRIVGESRARKRMGALRSRTEVSLGDIYAQVLPNAHAKTRKAAIAEELEAEAGCCFAFAPTVELMRAAKAKGMKNAIASDTYLDAGELGQLIELAGGRHVRDLIDTIFCSSQIGRSKTQGMLGDVLAKLKCNPSQFLHIGDNRKADFDAARALGIPALHLKQFSPEVAQRLRLEAALDAMLTPRSDGPQHLQPHRAVMASGEPAITDQAQRLGFGVLGPLFHAFHTWLEDEARALDATNKGKVHWLFMLRDGFLPREVGRVLDQRTDFTTVEISRYAATAASLTNRAAIEEHAAQELGLKPETLARQMLFEEGEIARYDEADSHTDAARKLHAELRSGTRQKTIERRSREYAGRLIAHIRDACEPQPGDTLMLIDLGYNGSAHNRIAALLEEELGVHVAGRYLLLREMEATGLDKRGLIDAEHFSPEALEAMCANVAVLEQLCTTAMGSAVDYSEDGKPIRSKNSVKGRQSAVREQVQAGCLAYARAAGEGAAMRCTNANAQMARSRSAAAVLARLMYLPLPSELAVVQAFEHDVNLGSERMVALFDAEEAREGLKRRGLFYMKGSSRMYLPAELAGEDMSLRLSLLSQKLLGLSLTYDDFASGAIELPVIYLDGDNGSQRTLNASPTHEGHFALRLPIGASRYSIAVQFGAQFDWLEIAAITASPLASLKDGEAPAATEIPLPVFCDGIEESSPGLFRCTREDGILLVHPPKTSGSSAEPAEELMVEIVFRPLAYRGQPRARLTTASPLRNEPKKELRMSR